MSAEPSWISTNGDRTEEFGDPNFGRFVDFGGAAERTAACSWMRRVLAGNRRTGLRSLQLTWFYAWCDLRERHTDVGREPVTGELRLEVGEEGGEPAG